MRNEYVITNDELAQRGLNLNDYALEGDLIPAIIYQGLGITIDRACKLGDIKSSKALEDYIASDDEDRTKEEKLEAFKEAQYRVIYNLIFMAETKPVDEFVDDPLVYRLGLKINGYQKGLFYRN